MSLTIRHGFAASGLTVSSAWARGLNIPPAPVEGMRGYVVVHARDALIQVLVRVTVQLVETETVYLAAPGRPVFVPIDRFGADISYRAVLITPYEHGADGVPTTTVNGGLGAPTGGVQIAYRPDGEPPVVDVPDLVVRTDDVLGSAWAGGTTINVRAPLGPPGLWRLMLGSALRIDAGTQPVSTQYSALAAMAGRDYGTQRNLEFNNTASAVATGINVPSGTSLWGASAPRWAQSPDGWGLLRVVLDAAPAADEVHRITQIWQYQGATLPSPTVEI